MKEYDFYVVSTEDGEIYVVKNLTEAEKLLDYYILLSGDMETVVRSHGYFFGDSIK